MLNESPLISVIIPTYNAAEYLPEALESILQQNYQNFEIIVIDDGSTDATKDALESYRSLIIYHYQENAGPASARNHGLRIAQGEIIAFLDADDIWPKDKIERQLSHLLEFPDAEIVVGRQRIEYLSNAKKIAKDTLEVESQVCQSMPIALIRRSAFDKVGSFDEELIYAEDWDWHLRAREKGLKILVYDEIANIHRRHASNMTNDVGLLKKYFFKMFQKSFKRRRENPNIKTKLPTISKLEQRSPYDK